MVTVTSKRSNRMLFGQNWFYALETFFLFSPLFSFLFQSMYWKRKEKIILTCITGITFQATVILHKITDSFSVRPGRLWRKPWRRHLLGCCLRDVLIQNTLLSVAIIIKRKFELSSVKIIDALVRDRIPVCQKFSSCFFWSHNNNYVPVLVWFFALIIITIRVD